MKKYIFRLKYFTRADDFKRIKKEFEEENPDALLIPYTMKLEYPIYGRWIPCSEALPDTEGQYIVTVKDWADDLIVSTDIYYERISWEKYENNVIAWATLPKPYKEGDE